MGKILSEDKNLTYEQISTALFIHPDTASRHINDYLNNNKLNK